MQDLQEVRPNKSWLKQLNGCWLILSNRKQKSKIVSEECFAKRLQRHTFFFGIIQTVEYFTIRPETCINMVSFDGMSTKF